ncbi:recombinase family protein [Actinomadura violacea]|uniref:Recombinase family protein n=1 Tax=Actinomadura violacea TaxID=2819934 RepID=A0ABS3RJE6_9ACTN|nr:recombinase family protein [Actinomadura violacea]
MRTGPARCSHLTQELQSQRDALAAAGIPRDKIFAEKVSTRVRVRPEFENALEACRQIKTHAPHRRVILTVYEMKRLHRTDRARRSPHHARHRPGNACLTADRDLRRARAARYGVNCAEDLARPGPYISKKLALTAPSKARPSSVGRKPKSGTAATVESL